MTSEDDVDIFNEYEPENQGKCGTIFLVDTRLPMFKKDVIDSENKQLSWFNIAIKCCRTVLMNKLVAKKQDLVGLVLFGTFNLDPKTNTKHVTLLLELNYPSADAVKQLDSLLSDDYFVEFQSKYGTSDDFLLADALWYCSSLFSHNRVKLEDKRILLFSNDSNPHATHPDRAHMARKRAKDLNQVKISLELLSMGPDFDYSIFYKELVEIINGKPEYEDVDSSSKVEELLERVNRLEFKTRRYSKIKWDLGKGVYLGISLYTLYREATVLSQDPLNRASNEPVKRLKQTFEMSTGELLLPSDIVEFVTIAGKDIVFTNEEKETLKKIAEPGITLLGFKPVSAVTEALHCGQPAFAYPEETLIKGSRDLFKALVERCIAKKKVALCCLTPRHRALTKYVYLVPTEETRNSGGKLLSPCGFHIIPLPFYNDTREQKLEKSPDVDASTVEIAKKIVTKLRFTYEASNFKNPKLQLFWAHLEALALEYDAPEEVGDDTLPAAKEQTKRLASLADEFNVACSLDGTPSTATKRSYANKTASPGKKARKTAPVNVVQDIRAAIPLMKVEKFTCEQLKEFLMVHQQKVSSSRKADLVKAVYNLNLD